VGIAICSKKCFAKILAAFQSEPPRDSGRQCFYRCRAELVDHSGDERRFRSGHRQVRRDFFGQRQVRGRRGQACADLRDARISGRGKYLDSLRLRQLPAQCVLSSTATEDQDSHFATIITMHERYDVVVIGAGHAGCEAARACARMGLRTAMVTMNLDLIAQMSCNPAIGGIAKGHLVREIDALGGLMGEVADAVGIQFRLLNTSRGPAVWSPRAQMDKRMYRVHMREVLEKEPNLRIKQAEVASLALDGRRVTGVHLRDGRRIDAGAVIVTTGTFLNGLAHVGEMQYSCGRNGEAPSQLLGDQLRTLGLPWTAV
jgi:hypothetical protein